MIRPSNYGLPYTPSRVDPPPPKRPPKLAPAIPAVVTPQGRKKKKKKSNRATQLSPADVLAGKVVKPKNRRKSPLAALLLPKSKKKRSVLYDTSKIAITRLIMRVVTREEAERQGWLTPDRVRPGVNKYAIRLEIIEIADTIQTKPISIKPATKRDQNTATMNAVQAARRDNQTNPPRQIKGSRNNAPRLRESNRPSSPQPHHSPAMYEAFERADHPDTKYSDIPDCFFDASKDYWNLRDHGQFGSYPSHDDYDE